MQSATLILLSLLAALTALTAHAAEPAICQDPVKFVCENRSPNPAPSLAQDIAKMAAGQIDQLLGTTSNLDTYVDDLRKELAYRPYQHTVQAAQPAAIRALLYIGCTDYLARAAFAGRLAGRSCFTGTLILTDQTTVESALGHVKSGDEFILASQALALARTSVNQVLVNSGLSPVLKNHLKARLEATPEVRALQFFKGELNYAMTNSAQVAQVIQTPGILPNLIDANCDLDLAAPNAFNYNLNGNNGLVVCPSFWIGAMATANAGSVGLALKTLSHEFGHTIEREIQELKNSGPESLLVIIESKSKYQSVISCMNARYVSNQSLTAVLPEFDDAQARSSFLNDLNFKPEEKIPEMYFKEYSADVISAKALAISLVSSGNPADRQAILKRSMDYYCDMKADVLQSPKFEENDLHPSGLFRIQNFLNEETLRKTLGCAPRAGSLNCSLL